MTLYELYCRRYELAAIEEAYCRGPWSWINSVLKQFWQWRIDRLIVEEAGKELLAVTPRGGR